MNSTYPSKKQFDRMNKLYGENHIITSSYDKELSAKCDNGTFVGKKKGDVLIFKGIPFAKAPINELRWKAPQYPNNSDNIYEAYYFGKSAIQEPWFSELASCYPQSEDCLYLNVWTNTKVNKDKTVMVFIHGGAYGYGGSSDPIYDGYNLVNNHEDAVLVTITYRVGIMGFIDFSNVEGGQEYEDSCNLGLLDQIMALRWIQNNIEAFGGNKDNVTVFGESAGGGSVSLLPIMDLAKGLFKRVIGESGSVALTYSKEECAPFTKDFLVASGAKNMADLLKLSTEEIQRYNKNLNEKNNFPMRDGRIVPLDPYQEYKNGKSKWCDMIMGSNKDECLYWINETGGIELYAPTIPLLFETQLGKMSKEDEKIARKFFYKNDAILTFRKITEFENDIIFRCPAQKQLQYHSMNGGVGYNYFYTYPSANKHVGACHAVELNHVFNNLDERMYTGDNVNEDLSNKIQTMWVNFAKYGDPSIESINWPKYDNDTRKTLIINEDIYVKEKQYSRRSIIIDELLKYYVNGSYVHLKLNNRYTRMILAVLVLLITIIVIIIKAL